MSSKRTVGAVTVVAISVMILAFLVICAGGLYSMATFDDGEARQRCEAAGGYWDEYEIDCEL